MLRSCRVDGGYLVVPCASRWQVLCIATQLGGMALELRRPQCLIMTTIGISFE